jgi:hypothetical protein
MLAAGLVEPQLYRADLIFVCLGHVLTLATGSRLALQASTPFKHQANPC